MSKLIKTVFILTLFCQGTISSYAQFEITGEYRPRFERRDGYRQLLSNNQAPAYLVSHRARLSFIYQTEKVRFKFTPQDVRTWGDEQLASSTGVYGDYASLDLLEANIGLQLFRNSWLSVGRQILAYDQQRLIAERNWNQNALSYDAVVFKHSGKLHQIHLGTIWNSEDALANNYYPQERIKSLNFLWFGASNNSGLNASLMHIASGETKNDSSNTLYFKHTTGIYYNYEIEPLKSKGNIYYQYGKNNKNKNISAILIDFDVCYKNRLMEAGIGISYLSGNKNPASKTDHLFDQLYGARHRFFGHMDYFRDMNTHTGNGGLQDYYAYYRFRINEKLSIGHTGHYFKLAETNATTPKQKNLGYENELSCNIELNEVTKLKAGYLFFLSTRAFEKLQGVDNPQFPQFFFLELNINTSLFKTNNTHL